VFSLGGSEGFSLFKKKKEDEDTLIISPLKKKMTNELYEKKLFYP